MTEIALDQRHIFALVMSCLLVAILIVVLFVRNKRLVKALQRVNAKTGADALTTPEAFSHPDSQQKALVEKLVHFMEQNKPYLESHITVERLANMLNVSPKLLSSTINNQLHMNFFELIGNYRVAEAKKRLADSELRQKPINEIMKSCGFNSKSVFNQAFKKAVGVTPSHYRQQHLQ